MLRIDNMDSQGTHILDLTVVKIIKHKGVNCAMRTFLNLLYLLIRQCLRDTFLVCAQYYTLKFRMLQNAPISGILTVGIQILCPY